MLPRDVALAHHHPLLSMFAAGWAVLLVQASLDLA